MYVSADLTGSIDTPMRAVLQFRFMAVATFRRYC
jgi:hypothetical protein